MLLISISDRSGQAGETIEVEECGIIRRGSREVCNPSAPLVPCHALPLRAAGLVRAAPRLQMKLNPEIETTDCADDTDYQARKVTFILPTG